MIVLLWLYVPCSCMSKFWQNCFHQPSYQCIVRARQLSALKVRFRFVLSSSSSHPAPLLLLPLGSGTPSPGREHALQILQLLAPQHAAR